MCFPSYSAEVAYSAQTHLYLSLHVYSISSALMEEQGLQEEELQICCIRVIL